MNYWRHLILFFLFTVESLMNLVAAVFYIYPKFDFGFAYWTKINAKSKAKFLKELKEKNPTEDVHF